jgi:hypothetical protein
MMNIDIAPRPLRRALRRMTLAAVLVATLGTAAACSTAEGGVLTSAEALPAVWGIVAVGPNVELSEETSKGPVTEAVMSAVRFVPLTVSD